jgi:hypothetical protein
VHRGSGQHGSTKSAPQAGIGALKPLGTGRNRGKEPSRHGVQTAALFTDRSYDADGNPAPGAGSGPEYDYKFKNRQELNDEYSLGKNLEEIMEGCEKPLPGVLDPEYRQIERENADLMDEFDQVNAIDDGEDADGDEGRGREARKKRYKSDTGDGDYDGNNSAGEGGGDDYGEEGSDHSGSEGFSSESGSDGGDANARTRRKGGRSTSGKAKKDSSSRKKNSRSGKDDSGFNFRNLSVEKPRLSHHPLGRSVRSPPNVRSSPAPLSPVPRAPLSEKSRSRSGRLGGTELIHSHREGRTAGERSRDGDRDGNRDGNYSSYSKASQTHHERRGQSANSSQQHRRRGRPTSPTLAGSPLVNEVHEVSDQLSPGGVDQKSLLASRRVSAQEKKEAREGQRDVMRKARVKYFKNADKRDSDLRSGS